MRQGAVSARAAAAMLHCAIACAAIVGAGPASAYVPVSRIRPGDTGYGLATFHGTEVSRYTVQVVDVLRSDGQVADAILVRVSGPEIEKAGGIASGMSGSPLYLDGELAGALSYAIPDCDPHYGYATPAEYFMPWLESASAPPVAFIPGPLLAVASSARGLLIPPAAMSALSSVQDAASPLPPLQPGAAVGVQLARGQINVTTMGTVTALSGNRVLLLGHKYLHEGTADYPLVRMSVGAILPSAKVPFAMANPVGDPIGTVVEDRSAGCLAILGRAPRLVPVSMAIAKPGGEERSLRVELVALPEVFRETAASAFIAATDAALDRVGPGSMELDLRLTCTGGFVVHRTDVVSSDKDAGGAAAAELREVLHAVLGNPFYPLAPEQVEIRVRAEEEPGSADVLACDVTPARAAPGETVVVSVRVRPFRTDESTQQTRLTIPMDLPPGVYRVRAHAKQAAPPGVFDPWERPPGFTSAAAFCEWISRSGCARTVACDLLRSPVDALLRSAIPAFDPGHEMGTRDVPPREARTEPSGLAGLLGAGEVLARQLLDTSWSMTGEASATVEVRRK